MKKRGILIGIWLDQSEAHVVRFEGGEMKFETLPSDIEHYNLTGGARSKVPYGPMDKTSESKKLYRHDLQEKNYFKNLSELVADAEEIYLFGPAQTKERFNNYLSDLSIFKGEVGKVEAASKMTKNQMVAQVREFFKLSVTS